MLARLCQLKTLPVLVLITISGCSLFSKNKDQSLELLTPMKNEWFSKNSDHALWNQELKPQSHQFFDVNPEMSKSHTYANVVVVTPENSINAYQLDISSGQRYFDHAYCKQNDVWAQYSGKIHKPTFSQALIPRLLDQLGEPQKVIVFGGAESFAKPDFQQHRVRLVGAFIEQTCPEGNCLGKSNWISRMVFVAVDPEDKNFKEINSIDELTKKIDWPMNKAVYENIDGRNGVGTMYPALRVGSLINIAEAMEYYVKRSIYMSDTETDKISKGCHTLYDKLWTDVGVERDEDKPARTVEALNTKVKLIQELKAKRKPVGFAARLREFNKKYYNEFTTCQKFVYAGNINKDSEKFWFLSYMGIYLRLHKEGHFYDCRGKAWKKNTINSEGKPVYDFKDGIDFCRDQDFDLAMDYLPNYLTSLKNNDINYYKFIDYDSSSLGTHQKLYSWVKIKSRSYECSNDQNVEIRKNMKVFPDDVNWKVRFEKDIADELKIIY